MTSAPNRRQLLSGNKWIIILLILSGISSCASAHAAGKTTISPPPKAEIISINTNPVVKTTKSEDSILKKPDIFDLDYNNNKTNITNSETISNNKNNLLNSNNTSPDRIRNIAVILPFHLDQISLGQYADDTTKQLNADSKFAMDFYLGCQMAKEKFSSKSLNANVYFLDGKNDTATVANLFNLKPFPNIDYIIGPLYAKNLEAISEYAKKTQIPMISPLVNSVNITNNPYYFNGKPSLSTQYDFIFNYLKKNYPTQKIEILFDDKDSTAEDINLLKPIANKYFGYSSLKYIPIQSWSDAAKTLYSTDTLSNRFIIIYSSKDSYAKSVITKLKPLKNHLSIFTTEYVRNTKNLADNKYPHTIYTVYPFNTDNPNYAVFAPKFEEKYKKENNETVLQAYDLMMHLFYKMEKNKALEDNTYNFTTDFDNTHTKFLFKPVYNSNGTIDYYDNTYLNLYKYVGGKFVIEN